MDPKTTRPLSGHKYPYLEDPNSAPWKIIRSFSPRDKFRLALAMTRTAVNPQYTQGIFQILDLFIKNQTTLGSGIIGLTQRFLADPELAALAAERYLPPPPDLRELATLPEDTLGYQYALHMTSNRLETVFYPNVDVISDLSWLELRGRQTHDIFHVVTGFSVSTPDELGLMAFTVGQLETPLGAGVLGGGLLQAALFSPWEIHLIIDAIGRGYKMGTEAKILVAYRYEDNWEKPLAVVRNELNIKVA